MMLCQERAFLLRTMKVCRIKHQQRFMSGGARIISSKYSQVELPDTNLCDFILQDTDKYRDYPAFVNGETHKHITFGEIKSLTRSIGSGLLDAGLKIGSKVATVLPNTLQFSSILLGTVGIGSVLVPLSPMLTPPEMERIFVISKPEVIFTLAALRPGVEKSLLNLDIQPLVVCLDENLDQSSNYQNILQADGSLFDKKADFDPSETLALLPFSSGTTGMPKGVMLSHKTVTNIISIVSNEESGCARGLQLQPETGTSQSSCFSVIPNYHIYGLTCDTLLPLYRGAKAVMLPRFEPGLFLSCLERYKPQLYNLVPPLVAFLALNPNVKSDVHLAEARHICSGGSPLSAVVAAAMEEKFLPRRLDLREGFGMTECAVVSRNLEYTYKPGCVGHLVNNSEAKIIDMDTGDLLGPNQPGELCLKSPMIMMGYYNNEEETKQTIRDGWLHTGDVLYYNENEELFVVDRIKDMIKVKGFQVPPTELEKVLGEMEGISEVAVIGVAHDRLGEAPRAYIIPAHDELDQDMVHAWLKDKVASYKQLAGGIVFVKDLPRSPTGKVLRKELRKL